jgi:hypothetical protein
MRFGVVLFSLGIIFGFALTASADTINVDAGEVNIIDNGFCSLREAVVNANDDAQTHDDCAQGNGADVINLAPGTVQSPTYKISNAPASFEVDGSNGLPSITTDITINGNDQIIERDNTLTCNINGTNAASEFRIFHNTFPNDLTLNQVTVRHGCADGSSVSEAANGGGIRSFGRVIISESTITDNDANAGGAGIRALRLVLTDSTVSDNTSAGANGAGGGIFVSLSLSINGSTISGNSINGRDGGGIAAIVTTPNVTNSIINSTISGNQAIGASGGGLKLGGVSTLNVVNSTFTDNTAATGGGIEIDGISLSNTFNIKNSVVGGNTGGDCLNVDGTFNATGDNLDTDGTCVALDADFAQVTLGQLNLDTLQNNGGETETHALLAGSVAIDAVADCSTVTFGPVLEDQRNVARLQPPVGDCDIGAFEFFPPGPDLITVKVNLTAGNAVAPDPFDWRITIRNFGDQAATFNDGEVFLRDNLPNGTVSYDRPSIELNFDMTGLENVFCFVDDAILECRAEGGSVSFGAFTGFVDVEFTANPMGIATLTNPTNGSCSADPDNVVVESLENNNECGTSIVNVTSPFGQTTPVSINLNSAFNIPFWCGERKEVFTMDGKEFTSLEQFETEVEIILPQKRILLIFPGPATSANLVETATITEPSNFETPGTMSIPFKVQIESGKTIRKNCNGIKAFPTRVDSGGDVDQLLGNVLSGIEYFHGIFTLETDSRDLKVFVNKIVRSWKCVDQGSGLDCLKGNQTRERKEISRTTANIRRTISLQNNPPPFAPIAVNSALSNSLKNFSMSASSISNGRAIRFRAQGMSTRKLDVEIFSLNGKKIFAQSSTGNSLNWRLRDSMGRPVANGIYLYVVNAVDVQGKAIRSEIKKLVVLR